METYSELLYARPSFLEGVARIFDFGGTLNEYNGPSSGLEADAAALWSDWAAVGEDMRAAIGAFEAELEEADASTK